MRRLDGGPVEPSEVPQPDRPARHRHEHERLGVARPASEKIGVLVGDEAGERNYTRLMCLAVRLHQATAYLDEPALDDELAEVVAVAPP